MSDWNKLWRGFRKVRNDVSRDVRKLKFSDVLDTIPQLSQPELQQVLGMIMPILSRAALEELGFTFESPPETVTSTDTTQYAWGIEPEKEGEAANGHEPNH